MIDKYIEVVRSTVPGLSLMSLKSGEAVVETLRRHYSRVNMSIVNQASDLEELVAKKPDLVFMGTKSVPDTKRGKVIWIAAFLELNGIAYTGSDALASEAEQNKVMAKQKVLESGGKTAAFRVVKNGDTSMVVSTSLVFPLFVKPASMNAGVGVDDKSVVHNVKDLNAKVTSIHDDHSADALIEEFLPGREFSVGILKPLDSDDLITMPIEMLPGSDINGDFMLSKRLKSGDLETPVAAVPEGDLRDSLNKLALKVFKSLGARDYGRIDMRLDAAGVPNFLEANLIPGLIEGSGNFTKACVLNQKLGYEAMILQIVSLGFAHPTAVAPSK